MRNRLVFAALILLGAACGGGGDGSASGGADSSRGGDGAAAGRSSDASAACAPDNGGITLPEGFCASVFADSLGHARHVAVAPNGDVYVNSWSGPYYRDSTPADRPFLVALRDTNRDGRADVAQRFGETRQAKSDGGTGIALYGGYLYAESGPRIVRYQMAQGQLAPSGQAEVIVDGFPTGGNHPQHNFVIDSGGALYANMGSASNACQQRDRTLQSPGRTPCAELETRAGIWRFDARQPGQHFAREARYATGIRNAVGLAFNPADGALYATQHGRDQLTENWPKKFTVGQGQELPAEVVVKVERGADYGWPTCYYDGAQRKLVLAPEYGGDGTQTGQCESKRAPAAAFPAHWAPNDLLFYRGSQFPEHYRGGAFVAFHGSWNRAPGPQGGYQVVFARIGGGQTVTEYEAFANGFAGGGQVQPDRAAHRPAGLAEGPDGALYITDDQRGRVWKVVVRR